MKVVQATRKVYKMPDGKGYTRPELEAYIKGLRIARNTCIVEIDKALKAATDVLAKGPQPR